MKYLIIVLALVTTTKAHAADTAYCGDVCTSCAELCADDTTCKELSATDDAVKRLVSYVICEIARIEEHNNDRVKALIQNTAEVFGKELQRQHELFRRTLIAISVSVTLIFIGTLCLIFFLIAN